MRRAGGTGWGGGELANQQGSHKSGEGAIERMTDRDRAKDGEEDTDRERWKQ